MWGRSAAAPVQAAGAQQRFVGAQQRGAGAAGAASGRVESLEDYFIRTVQAGRDTLLEEASAA